MNIFELLLFTGIIAAGYKCGKWFGSYYGIAGWIAGFLIGVGLAVLAWFILSKLLGKLPPPFPKCKNNCSPRDYKYISYHEGDGAIWQCRCGAKYLFSYPQFFKEILDDGSLKPFMKRKNSFARWRLDE